jgi:hypothetical protein
MRHHYLSSYLEKDKSKIERVNRRAARFVTSGYSTRRSVTTMLEQLGWNTLEERRQETRIVLMFKDVHQLLAVPPTYLTYADSRTRTNHPYKLRTIRCNTSAYKHSYFPRRIPQWNSLPSDIVTSTTLDTSKSRLAK